MSLFRISRSGEMAAIVICLDAQKLSIEIKAAD
jgi:hypothetical protein